MIELEQIKQATLFDYTALDESTRCIVRDLETELDSVLKRTSEEIGAILLKVKERLPHGAYMPWLASRGMSESTAWRCMQIAQGKPISKSFIMKDLPLAEPCAGEAKRELQQERIIPQHAFPSAFYHDPAIFTEENEESRYQTAVDMGTTDLYYDNLRRDAIQRDKEERRDAHVMRVMGSSDSPEWYTPHEIIERVLECFGEVDTDPCSNSHDEPAVPARILYTREDDGLSHGWEGKVYLNPPYGDEIKVWVQRLVQEYESGAITEAIALLPARIDTVWFQPLYAYPMCNVRGRLQFENSPYHCPFPCVIVYLGKTPDKFISTFKGLGPIMGRIG